MKFPVLAIAALLLSMPATAAQFITAESVGAFFDEAWESNLSADGKVPGIAVSVVKDREILLSRGYGTRDIDTGEPILADRTRVRIGSVTKVFTALTALSLVDEGKMDLDTDINQYLDAVMVPPTFGQPITLRSMLTHHSGFASLISAFMTHDYDDIDVSPELYNRFLIRLRPVGQVHAYDNTALGLMGHVNGRVNGTTFEQAVAQHVTEPWGMSRTALGMPAEVLVDVAGCHSYSADETVVKCDPKVMRHGFQGAGDVATTADDMARFMIGLLNGGELDGVRLISPALHQQMFDMDTNRMHPSLNGLGLILMESRVNGHVAIGHGGGQDGFSTSMLLFPQFGVGVFMSALSYPGIPEFANIDMLMDSMKRAEAGATINAYGRMNETMTRFAEAFFPTAPARTQNAGGPATPGSLDLLDGNFISPAMTFSDGLLTRMMSTFSLTPVRVAGDKVFIAGKGPYREVAPALLAMEDDEMRYVHKQTGDTVLLNNTSGMVVGQLMKAPWHLNGKLLVLPLMAAIMVGLLGGLHALLRRKSPAGRQISRLVFVATACLAIGLALDFKYFPQAYFLEEFSLLMVFWRLLINLSWLLAAYGLWKAVQNRAYLFGAGGIGAIAESLYFFVLMLGLAAILVLVPYWGLLLNFTH
jgi:CubicO group peptidase (beta-lactamase class C family)